MNDNSSSITQADGWRRTSPHASLPEANATLSVPRLIAIVPAVFVTALYGASGTTQLLIPSHVVSSMQLSFAVFPLVRFTSDKLKMGEFVNPLWRKVLGYTVAVVIAALNVWLLVQTFSGWLD